MSTAYPKIAQLKSVEAFRDRLAELELDLPIDDRVLTAEDASPMASPLQIGGFEAVFPDPGPRFCDLCAEDSDRTPFGRCNRTHRPLGIVSGKSQTLTD